jgi:hypothetical protein
MLLLPAVVRTKESTCTCGQTGRKPLARTYRSDLLCTPKNNFHFALAGNVEFSPAPYVIVVLCRLNLHLAVVAAREVSYIYKPAQIVRVVN